MTQRTLDQGIFATLSITDKMRAYLLRRTTPVPRATLLAVTQACEVAAHLAQDIKQGRVRRPQPGHYLLTPKGRAYYATTFPPGLLGVRIPQGKGA